MAIFNILRNTSIISGTFITLCLCACQTVQKSVDVDKIYFGNVDENPLFNGKPAEEEFREYVGKMISYPALAARYAEDIIAGCVFVELIVERDGSVSNVKVVGGADSILEAEALRVVNSSPNWTPGKIDGRAVRMSYTIPINFKGNGETSTTSSKKAKLSKKTILLKEVDIVVFGVQGRKSVVTHD